MTKPEKREAYRRVAKLISDAILESEENRREGSPSQIPDQVGLEMAKIAATMDAAGGVEDLPVLNDLEIYQAVVVTHPREPNKCCGSTELKFDASAGGIICGKCSAMLTGFDNTANA